MTAGAADGPPKLAGASFGRRRRLRTRHEFDAVLRSPALRFRRGSLWLAAKPAAGGEARLGLIVAKRLLRRAVDRNRAKRAIRESFRQRSDLPAMDVVVRVVGVSRRDVRVPGQAQAERVFAALADIVAKRAARED